jgi:hypothetical protein
VDWFGEEGKNNPRVAPQVRHHYHIRRASPVPDANGHGREYGLDGLS